MKKKVCKHCRKEVSGDHECHFTGEAVYYDSTSDFLTSFVIGSVPDISHDSGGSDSGGGCDSGAGGGE